MADPNPTSFFSQPWSLTASGGFASRISVTRAGVTINVDLVPTGTQYFRTYLCASAGAGTSWTAPQEWLAYVQARLVAISGAGWTVAMTASGRVAIGNSGNSHAIDWTGTSATGAIARNLLGFDANITGGLAGQTATGAYLPTHTLASFARVGDEGWQSDRAFGVFRTMPDKRQYGWSSGYRGHHRVFDSRFHPTDAAAMTALGSTITPLHAAKARWKQPTLAPSASLTPPWSVEDFVETSAGYNLGCAFGTFQELVAGTTSEVDVCTLDDACRAELKSAPMAAGYSRRRDVKGLRFHWYGTETR
jgi:hypothetical protein